MMPDESCKIRSSYRSCNWLIHRLHDAVLGDKLNRYARGLLLDIGCGEKPYRGLTQGRVAHHLGLDHPGSLHSKQWVDIFSTACEIGLADDSVDTILCTFALEHLETPQLSVHEMYRVLKVGGYAILSAPLFWHVHEAPRDFYRYTKYGLDYLLTTAGFEVVDIQPLSGFVVTFGQELAYFLKCFRRGPFKYLRAALQWAIQLMAYELNPWDRSHEFTWAYLAVARKAERATIR